MTTPRKPGSSGYLRVIPGMIAVYLLIAIWEMLSTPMISHSNSGQGMFLSLLAFPLGAYRLARHPGSSSRFFLFGFAGSLLFVRRFFLMDRFSLWLYYSAPSDAMIFLGWVMFATGLGVTCLVVAMLRQTDDNEVTQDRTAA